MHQTRITVHTAEGIHEGVSDLPKNTGSMHQTHVTVHTGEGIHGCVCVSDLANTTGSALACLPKHATRLTSLCTLVRAFTGGCVSDPPKNTGSVRDRACTRLASLCTLVKASTGA